MAGVEIFSWKEENQILGIPLNTCPEAKNGCHNFSNSTTTPVYAIGEETSQIPNPTRPSPPQPEWLITSPYTEAQHQLDLTTLDLQNRLMALALTSLTHSISTYANPPYSDSFNWSTLMNKLHTLTTAHTHRWAKSEFYVVEFRSKLKPAIDVDLLFKLDKESHAEAAQSGGLLKYWYGTPDAERRNLATCIWRNKEDAVQGGRGPWHKQARAIVPCMYEDIQIRGLRLVVEDDVRGWHFSSY